MTAARKLEPAKLSSVDAGGDPSEHAGENDELVYGEEWEQEVERQAEELCSGKVRGIPWEEVAAEIRAKYGWA